MAEFREGDDIDNRDTERPEYVKGEILVKFKPGWGIREKLEAYEKTKAFKDSQKRQGLKKAVPDKVVSLGISSVDALFTKHRITDMEKVFRTAKVPDADGTILFKGERKKVPDLTTIYKLTLPDSADILKLVEEYGRDPNVEYAEPNYIYHTYETIPNEYANRAALTAAQWSLDKIQAPEAWNIETGSSDVIIGIIDTGVDWDHPDLAANIWTNPGEDPWSDPNDPTTGNGIDDDANGYVDDWKGWDFVTINPEAVYPGEDPGPPDNNPMDFDGHGTRLAGIATGVTNNAKGIAGIAWNCKIMSIRAGFKNAGGMGQTESSWYSPAIVYASDNGAKVINMSFGGRCWAVPQTTKEAVDYADSLGVVLVAAAGNSNSSHPIYPAFFENVIAVAATDENDAKASFSNYGSWIDVAAPGVGIYSTSFDNTYDTRSGTSSSSSIVAGIAALILSKNSTLSNEQVMQILESSADDVGSSGWDIYSGYGRVNAYKALQINTICTASIDSPTAESVVRGNVNIIGTAFGNDFDHYTLEWGYGEAPTSWSSIGVNLTNGGVLPIVSGVLATLNMDALNQWEFSVRLHVFDSHGNVSYFRRILFNGNLMLEGWPVEIIGFPNGGGTNGAVVTDIDGDGDNEVVVGSRNGGAVNILHHDGSLLSGWPNGTYSQTPPSIGDVDGDGDMEIVPGCDGGWIQVHHHNGTLLSGWPQSVGGQVIQSPALADIDNDGKLEIFCGSGNNNVYGWRYDGTLLPGWPITVGDRALNGPSIGDIDGDGDLEILLGAWDNKVYAWHHDETTVNGWPISIPDCPQGTPSLADVDGDGKLEVFVTACAWPNIRHVYGWKDNGTPLPGWPVQNVWAVQGPTIGDIDGDGDLEILTGESDNDTLVSAWHHDGTPVSGWPVAIVSTGLIMGTAQPMIGDIDGDGDVEVVAGVSNNYVYAWHHDGTLVDSWPRRIKAAASQPTLADVDGDGFIDIIAGGDDPNLYIWKTLKTYDPSNVPWYTYRLDNYHTSWYGFENIKPQAITNLSYTESGDSIILHWPPVTEDVQGNSEQIKFYKVYRGTTYDFAPTNDNLIGTTTDTTYTDSAGVLENYCYVVRALDKYCNLSDISNRVMPRSIFRYYVFPQLGWNLISWDVDTPNDSVEILLSDIIENVDIVLGFEGSGLTYDPDFPQFSNLQLADHLHGYWIKTNAVDTLTVTGIVVPDNTPIEIEAGWNLVSYLPDYPDSVAHALASIWDYVVVVMGFDEGGLTYHPDWPQFSNLKILYPGFGYWIKMTVPGTLVYPDTQVASDGFLAKSTDYISSGSKIVPTNEWISVFGDGIVLDGEPLKVGTTVKAKDPNGVICGEYVVRTNGCFGFMPVYRDDPATNEDEGAEPGDYINFYIDGVDVEEKIVWNSFGEVHKKGLTPLKTVIPTEYALSQNYPNPFNPVTRIKYQLPKSSHVSCTIYNNLGQQIKSLVNEQKVAGYYTISWDGKNDQGKLMSSGVYFCQITAGDFIKTRKMLFLR
ncbi:MAG: S8 family serine peptidase [bacterium]